MISVKISILTTLNLVVKYATNHESGMATIVIKMETSAWKALLWSIALVTQASSPLQPFEK